ncbi:MAG: hypothetical protein ACLQBK_10255 [Candidatus Sulfotelmatobacter sp.]
MTPIALAAMVIAILLIFVLPRKWVIVPFLFFTFLVPTGGQFNVGGLHLFAHRIVVLFGCVRLFTKSSSIHSALAGGFTGIDKIFLAWAFCRATAFVLLYHVGGAVTNQLGFIWDTLGGYFFIRYLIRDVDDIRRAAKVLVLIAVIMSAAMVYEHYKLTNIFGLLMGGKVVPDIRYGNVRCRGVFQQQIIASAFGGTLVPLFIWLWSAPKAKIVAVLGLIASVIITITASSSTGISAAAIGVGALCLWPLRQYTRWMRWGLVAVILGLVIVMNAPVWFLLARVDFVGGSTGWDRANLIDQCVRHIGSWWLVGTADNDTWGFFTWDLCNQFVAEAVQGGLATLVLFLVLITRCFKRLGVARKISHYRSQQWLLWTIGCILCAHIAGFFGISYFDQMKYWWFVTLAMIPAVAVAVRVPAHPSGPELVSEPSPVTYFAPSATAGDENGRSPDRLVPSKFFD